jgi:hypothetical protein
LVFRYSRQRSYQNPGISQVQGWLWCLILGLSYSLQFSLHSHDLLPHHSTTDWKSFLYLISQPHTHTQSTTYLFEEWVMTTFLTWWRSYSLSLFSSMKQIILFTPNCSRAYSPV